MKVRPVEVWGLLWLFLALAPRSAVAKPQQVPGHVPGLVHPLKPQRRLDPNTELSLAVNLPLRNAAGLQQLLQELYDPGSPNFHHYLSAAEFAQRFGPSAEDYAAVTAFCETHGLRIQGLHPNRTVLDVAGKVETIEKVFHTTLQVYRHPQEHRAFYAPEVEPSLDLSVPLRHIHGLDNLNLPRPLIRPARKAKDAQPLEGSGIEGTYLGGDFRRAYAPGVTLTGSGQALALVEFDGFYPADVALYDQMAGVPAVPLQTVLVDGFNGRPSTGSDSANAEVALDIEMAVSMAPGLSKILVYEAGRAAGPIDVLNRIATDNLARQISCSWSWQNYAVGSDQIFQQFAAQGQSFFQASGDAGAFNGQPDAPCDDPYVTVVGGTGLLTDATGAWLSEGVWNDQVGDAGGGGVSTRYALPSWQSGLSTNFNLGSTSFRNSPDVAIVANAIVIVSDNGVTNTLAGTSVGAPLWAGFMALVNQQAALNGEPPVGFINPVLYGLGRSGRYLEAFHDIASGDNWAGGSGPAFPAVAGYDLSTGWGSPTGQATIDLLLAAANAQVDHFLWAPLDGTVPQSGPFEVTVVAETVMGTIASGFNGAATLSAAEVETNSVFADDFETGNADDWTPGGGGYTVVLDSSTGAAGTTHSLSLMGGDTNVSYNGLSHALLDVSPEVFEFYVKAGAAGVTCGYVVAGAAAYRTNAVFHFRMDGTGQMGLTDGGGNFYGTPFVPNQWYKIDLRLNWAKRTVDYYVDGQLVAPGVPFCNPNLSSLAVVFLYNYDATQAWWDEFNLLQSTRLEFAVNPDSTTAFTQGVWSGSVSLTDTGTNLVLTARDNSGHTGESGPFKPGSTNLPNSPFILAQPESQALSLGDTIRLRVVAVGTSALSYQWYASGNGSAHKLAGATAATLTQGPATSAMAGNYYVVVTDSASPPHSVTSQVAQVSVLTGKAPLAVEISGDGTVSPVYTGQLLQIGKQYTITAKPGSGSVFSGWSGSVTSTAPTLSFVMRSNLLLRVTFTPNPFTPLAGTYQGLFYDTNGVATPSAGLVTAVVSTRGTFSARVQSAGKTYPLSGQFMGNSGWYLGAFARGKTDTVAVNWQLDVAGSNGLSGSLSGSNWTAQLVAARCPFNTRSTPAPQAGKYTLLLPGTGEFGAAPGGDGYATLNVRSSGSVQVAGALADGTRLTQAALLGGTGHWPLFASLYSGSGLVLGRLSLSNAPDGDINGLFTWVKPSGGKIDSSGFAFTNGVLGSQYAFQPGTPVLNVGTGQVWLASSALPKSFTNSVVLPANNKALNLSPNKLTLSLTTASGLFRGQAVEESTGSPIPFSGVVLQKQGFGAGFFLQSTQSGEVFLGPTP